MSAPKSSLPVDKPAYARWSDRLNRQSVCHRIPALLVLECSCLLNAYYGNWFRAALAIFGRGLSASIQHIYWGLVYRFCDKVGWTRLQAIPGTLEGFAERHGAQCDKHNCQDIDCVVVGSFEKL